MYGIPVAWERGGGFRAGKCCDPLILKRSVWLISAVEPIGLAGKSEEKDGGKQSTIDHPSDFYLEGWMLLSDMETEVP